MSLISVLYNLEGIVMYEKFSETGNTPKSRNDPNQYHRCRSKLQFRIQDTQNTTALREVSRNSQENRNTKTPDPTQRTPVHHQENSKENYNHVWGKQKTENHRIQRKLQSRMGKIENRNHRKLHSRMGKMEDRKSHDPGKTTLTYGED